MKNFITINDLPNFKKCVENALIYKIDPFIHNGIGKNKTIGLLFFNPSLRTRLSTQLAAQNLGLNIMVMNLSTETWALEFEDGTKMSGIRSEHVKEAAAVISQYCDIIGIRAFANLTDKNKDEAEIVLNSFSKYAKKPILNMESSTSHPLQAIADAITIKENMPKHKPKVVLTWAPHPKALPHAVGNSFTRMINHIDADYYIAQPEGYELDSRITKNAKITYNQSEALENADFVYAKNWASYSNYGQILKTDNEWMLTKEKMKITNNAKFMHCLPVRRNIIVSDEVLDNKNSLVIQQANNRTFAAQSVIKLLIDGIS
ncbi:MAG: acetylornithine carbamoyltransferase [Flavobacteriaceae bacterium]|nr:acetylornithine carbamoyltransferase [Flavobacteriaceae bacterium]|tara:strand:- start:902 stop:1852 length:951 start_codon:yes stop_codon:yes gene_type:complete